MENTAELSNKEIKAAPLQISPICSQCTLPLPLEHIKGCIGVNWVKLLQKRASAPIFIRGIRIFWLKLQSPSSFNQLSASVAFI